MHKWAWRVRYHAIFPALSHGNANLYGNRVHHRDLDGSAVVTPKTLLSAFVSGLIFALGLGLSRMTDANTVLAFLDLSGDWNPALAFVMVGAIAVHLPFYRMIRKRERPLLAERFHIPTTNIIDKKLVLGAAIFGVGWGLGGYCPGPALVSLVSFDGATPLFVAAMATGMIAQNFMRKSPQRGAQIEDQDETA